LAHETLFLANQTGQSFFGALPKSMPTAPRIIFCIPGPWPDLARLASAVARGTQGEYSCQEDVLTHAPTLARYELQLEGHDARMRAAFADVGQDGLDKPHLSAIDHHTSVVYLLGPGGDFFAAEATMHAGQALLRAGGLGLKVETAGKAFAPEAWAELLADEEPGKFYEAFVALVTGHEGAVYSCGLHNVGLRDAACPPQVATDEAVEVITAFIFYLLYDEPLIYPGQTFATEPGARPYRIGERPCTEYPPDDLYHNPYGRYWLVPA
jgi:hypothetical protein